MKIPRKDGTTDLENDAVENWEDILCDLCGKSCRDVENMNYEYATIEATWGYGSKKDLQRHEAQICEACYDGLGLKPKVTCYFGGGDAIQGEGQPGSEGGRAGGGAAQGA